MTVRDFGTPESKGANFKLYTWQKHCRGLYQTLTAARARIRQAQGACGIRQRYLIESCEHCNPEGAEIPRLLPARATNTGTGGMEGMVRAVLTCIRCTKRFPVEAEVCRSCGSNFGVILVRDAITQAVEYRCIVCHVWAPQT